MTASGDPAPAAPSGPARDAAAPPPTVLVVDDDAATVTMLCRRLERSGYAAVPSGDGRQALDIVASNPVSCVLLDIVMPGFDGFEVLKRLRLERAPTELPVIMVTGKDDINDVVKALGMGANDYVTKPFEFPVVRARIAAQVAIKAGHDNLQALYAAERELLEKTLAGSVKALFDILALADPRAFGKAAMLRDWARLIGEAQGMERRWELELAAMLSQLALVGLPEGLLSKMMKGQRMAAEEMALFEAVPGKSGALLANIPRLETVRDIVLLTGRALDEAKSVDARTRQLARILRALIELAALTAGKYPGKREFDVLAQRRIHDPTVLAMLQECFDAVENKALLQKGAVIRILVAELQPGDVLVSDIHLIDGTLILAAGQHLTALALDRIRETGRYAKVRAGPARSTQNEMKQFREPVQVLRAGA